MLKHPSRTLHARPNKAGRDSLVDKRAIAAMRVTKKLASGLNGTKRYLDHYGESLVCVRYRDDGEKRYTTVELVVNERPLPPRDDPESRLVSVQVGYAERELRVRVKQAGARWDPERQVWRLPLGSVRKLGLLGRVLKRR